MTAVVCPGQGSQAPGMGRSLYESTPEARAVFEEVSAVTGLDVARLCFESDEATLRSTENAQVALYATGLAAFRALSSRLQAGEIKAAVGHSVGEYAALAASEVLSTQDGANLVYNRGLLMAEAGRDIPGTMAAVLGLDSSVVQAECVACSGVCVVANDNCPGQIVISGEVSAVAECSERLTKAGAKRVLPLNVSGAFHSPLLEAASRKMAAHLATARYQTGTMTVFSNVTAQPGKDWPILLERQLKSPVRWTESIQNMVGNGATTFIECGHGSVLSGLIKRIAPGARILAVNDLESLEKTVAVLEGATV